jgi:hypothetical protein
MKAIKLNLIFALLLGSSVSFGDAKSTCTVKAQDPVIQSFFRSKGFEVDYEKGDFEVEFDVTCEAIEKKKESFSSTEIHQTTVKLEIFNQYENQKVVYHTEADIRKSGRVESALMVPCLEIRIAKQKLLEKSLAALESVNCDAE